MDPVERAAEWLLQHEIFGIKYTCSSCEHPSKGRRWFYRWRGMDVDRYGTDSEFMDYCKLLGYVPQEAPPDER